MVDLQILNKILSTKSFQLVLQHNLIEEHFLAYQKQFNFIKNHYIRYNSIPDIETFLNEFKDFELLEVRENDKYLIDKIQEEHLYYKTVPIIQKVAELITTDANIAVEYLLSKLNEIQPSQYCEGTNIIKEANVRLEEYNKKLMGNCPQYISTGFVELDHIFNGLSRGEELCVLFARIGQGKSWVLNKMLMDAWKNNHRVGLISPEMSPVKIGYRFDTLYKQFSNKNLVFGREQSNYSEYIDELKKQDNPYIVATPQDFNKKITISKLKQFCEQNKLDILGIDGITYLTDERGQKSDNKTISLTNISEDLLQLSNDLKIPVVVVCQANRSGVRSNETNDTPDLDNMGWSDGIAANATKVLSIAQKESSLSLGIKKHRDGVTGGNLLYSIDFDTGLFNYIPNDTDAFDNIKRDDIKINIKNSYNDKEDIF